MGSDVIDQLLINVIAFARYWRKSLFEYSEIVLQLFIDCL
jgi:hypothetical protein